MINSFIVPPSTQFCFGILYFLYIYAHAEIKILMVGINISNSRYIHLLQRWMRGRGLGIRYKIYSHFPNKQQQHEQQQKKKKTTKADSGGYRRFFVWEKYRMKSTISFDVSFVQHDPLTQHTTQQIT